MSNHHHCCSPSCACPPNCCSPQPQPHCFSNIVPCPPPRPHVIRSSLIVKGNATVDGNLSVGGVTGESVEILSLQSGGAQSPSSSVSNTIVLLGSSAASGTLGSGLLDGQVKRIAIASGSGTYTLTITNLLYPVGAFFFATIVATANGGIVTMGGSCDAGLILVWSKTLGAWVITNVVA